MKHKCAGSSTSASGQLQHQKVSADARNKHFLNYAFGRYSSNRGDEARRRQCQINRALALCASAHNSSAALHSTVPWRPRRTCASQTGLAARMQLLHILHNNPSPSKCSALSVIDHDKAQTKPPPTSSIDNDNPTRTTSRHLHMRMTKPQATPFGAVILVSSMRCK